MDYEDDLNPYDYILDAEMQFIIAPLRLNDPTEEKVNIYKLAAKDYKKALNKMAKYIRDELKYINIMNDAADEILTPVKGEQL